MKSCFLLETRFRHSLSNRRFVATIAFLALALSAVPQLSAHCDALDGPVVEAARAAIAKNDISPVLKWVTKAGEKEIQEAFSLTMNVRSQGADAAKLADTHFFETLVRVHRAGEGEPYTGLKPAGAIDPGFLAADQALHSASITQLEAKLIDSLRNTLRERFTAVVEKRQHADQSVEAGRAYVAAYVEYAHFVESLHTLTSGKDSHEPHRLHSTDQHEK